MAVLFIIISKYYRNLLRFSARARFTDYFSGVTTVLQILLSI